MAISKATGLALIGAMWASLGAGGVMAQEWPGRQHIKIVVPFSAGSATDIIARTVFDQVGKQVGQTMILENRVGAGGTIGANAVAKAEPDGYTLLVTSSSHTVTPSTYKELPYHPVNDLAAVAPLGNIPNVLVVSSARGYKTPADVVKAARANPAGLNFASAGMGSAAHLTAEQFKISAKFDAKHVPFKGAPEALTEILADRIDFYFCPLLPAQSLIKDGKLSALAVSNSARALALPNVPTLYEAGIPNATYDFWIGVLAPRKLRPVIVERLHKEIAAALADPAIAQKIRGLGADPMKLSPGQFDALIAREIKDNAGVVKAAGVKAN